MAVLDAGLVEDFPNLDADALREVTETALENEQLNNFLNMAYYHTRVLEGKLGACGGRGQEELIVKFLAAHFLTTREQQPMSESSGEWSVRYRGHIRGAGLESSLYGQQAIVLDCSRTLANQVTGLQKATLESVTYYDIHKPPRKAVL